MKYGLSCVAACKNCNGVSCENANEVLLDADDLLSGDMAELTDIDDGGEDDVLDEDNMELIMPWVAEEEIVTSI